MSTPDFNNLAPHFRHRACYVNFAEHLQNRWNPNLYYPNAPNLWSTDDWARFLKMLKAFGFNIFEYWVPPTLFDHAALRHEPVPTQFAATMREVTDIAHGLGLRTKYIVAVNTIGAEWFFACPNIPEQKELILKLWRHWVRELAGTDIVGIFPGDPGGCNRNGCSHETFVDLSLELCDSATYPGYMSCPTARATSTSSFSYGVNYNGGGPPVNGVFDWTACIGGCRGSRKLADVKPSCFLAADNSQDNTFGGWTTAIVSSHVFLFTDETDGDLIKDSSAWPPGLPYGGLDPRHLNGACFLLADGSARWLSICGWASNQDQVWIP